jgi:LPS-assembly lipoprotein
MRAMYRSSATVSAMPLHLRFIVLVCATLIAGCGFQLRGEANLPDGLRQLRLDMVDTGPRIRRELVAALERGGVTLMPADAVDAAVLRVPVNQAYSEALTISEQARVREYAVRHRVEFEVISAEGTILMPRQVILLERDFVFDERDALGVAGQEEALRGDLEREMVRAILRRIEAVGASLP